MSFFESFATGFLNTASANIQAEKQKAADVDKYRQQKLLDLDIDKQLLDYRAKVEAQQRQDKLNKKRASNRFLDNAISQTPDAIFNAPKPVNPALAPVPQSMGGGSEIDDSGESPFPASSPIETNVMPSVPPTAGIAPAAPQEEPINFVDNEGERKLAAMVWDKVYDPDKDNEGEALLAIEEAIKKKREGSPEYKALVAAKEAAAKAAVEAGTAGEIAAAKEEARITASNIPPEEFEAQRVALGLPEIKRKVFRNSVQEDTYKKVMENTWAGKDAREAYTTNQQLLSLANEFTALNKGNPTGGPLFAIPYAGQVAGMFSAEYGRMSDIEKQFTMKVIKALGSGTAISDADRQYAAMAGLNVMKLEEVNEAQAAAIIGLSTVQNEYQDYMRAVSSVQGDDAEADMKWKEYTNANPVFNSKEPGNVQLNEGRVPYQLWFQGGRAVGKKNGKLVVEMPDGTRLMAE